ncbi:hypothetical protein [Pseudoalteromonas rubra]|uniref:Fibronectin type-III domain-containing protein n=1 Tax=Pseudoalteromonas rubra TaxID=43658 RepID=A0A0U2PC31_9GAMM|nr:hypothetical protein [Pseudoalteromonas rubra]ALU44685.1 hypothetical protein AT705_18100 [Pseudoalteromonas rubra]
MNLRFLLLLAMLHFVASNAFASSAIAPANSYYLLDTKSTGAELSVNSSGASNDGHFFIRWPDFKGPEGIYTLEYRNSQDNNWHIAYNGNHLYYASEHELDSGVYEFRVKCAGYSGCPTSGYLLHTLDVVHDPEYVNLAYHNRQQNVNVYWQQMPSTEGYVIEQSLDYGRNWEEVIPEGQNSKLYHGENHTGFVSTSNDVTVPKQTQIAALQRQGTLSFARQAVAQATSPTAPLGSFRYRIKNCNSVRCGNHTESNQYTEQDLRPLMQDPSFEHGMTQFLPNNAKELEISTARPINGEKSLRVSLENWGYIEWEKKYVTWNNYAPRSGLNGLTARGKLRVDYLAPDARLSVYPVAYYLEGGKGHRLEGQQLVIRRASSSETDRRLVVNTVRGEHTVDAHDIINIDQQIWLSRSHQIKTIKYYVRLVGSQARFHIDDAQLYENGGLGQYDPTLSLYLSNYIGELKSEWTDFARHNNKEAPNEGLEGGQCQRNDGVFRYHVEYTPYGESSWNTFYCGIGTRYFNSASRLHSGKYEFRLKCRGNRRGQNYANCPADGYVRGYSAMLREVESLRAQASQRDYKVYLSWPKTLGAYGYVIEQKTNNSGWGVVTPSSSQSKMIWRGNTMFTENVATIERGLSSGNDYQYRIKACRYTRCQENYGYSNTVRFYGHSMGRTGQVINFKADKPRIIPSEDIVLSWERPKALDGSEFKDFLTYKIYVTKPSSPEFLKWSNINALSIRRGGDTGIQKLGTQRFRILACDSYGQCSGEATTTVEVVGPPPMPLSFSSDQSTIRVGNSIRLSWQMSSNYTSPVTFNVYVIEPGMSNTALIPLLQNSQLTTLEQRMNKPGRHTFLIEACNQDGCSTQRSVDVAAKLSAPILSHH